MIRVLSRNRLLAIICAGYWSINPAYSSTDGVTITQSTSYRNSVISGLVNPVLFVTQTPAPVDFTARLSSFGNHTTSSLQSPRGGDLWIRYPDGSLRNLTKEAGFGQEGLQEGANAIAVRDPAVHWDAQRAVFSMLVGAPVGFAVTKYYWQLYEVTGLGLGETARITRVANQSTEYNNIMPVYGSDDRIIYVSDRPFNGAAHLYPQLDEYESAPTNTGLWSLDPVSGDLKLLDHSPSGNFSPTVDSFGRVVFMRWDHLKQDQQAGIERAEREVAGACGTGHYFYGSIEYATEAAGSAVLPGLPSEVFPEAFQQWRFNADCTVQTLQSTKYGGLSVFDKNDFTLWMINQDGTDGETLNHVGSQELNAYLPANFVTDPALNYQAQPGLTANTKKLRGSAGLLHPRENPRVPGEYLAIYAPEFGALASDQIVRVTGGDPATNPRDMQIQNLTRATDPNTGTTQGGRYRNPLPTAGGALIAAHTETETTLGSIPAGQTVQPFRLRTLIPSAIAVDGLYSAGQNLTTGISKPISWRNNLGELLTLDRYGGVFWELEPVELVSRPRPAVTQTLQTPSLLPSIRTVFDEESVSIADLQSWLTKNNLALMITMDQTSRDQADRQQPINLRIPGGKQTLSSSYYRPGYPIYDLVHFQIMQATLVRGYRGLQPGRRVLSRAISSSINPPTTGPQGSVKIAPDGSTAAFVPAGRALAWQSSDAEGTPIIRERVWITAQAGEIRGCAGCHGANRANQAGVATPVDHKPEALRSLLRYWRSLPKN